MSRDAKVAGRFRGLSASERNSADLYSGLADAATGERASERASERRKILTACRGGAQARRALGN